MGQYLALAEGGVVGGRHEDLDEAGVGGAAVDLFGGALGVLGGDHDGGAQAGLGVEPFG